jgi:hypothetical protein
MADAQLIANAVAQGFAALPAVVGFARTPAQARANILDYENSAADGKIFTKATGKLKTTFSTTTPNVTILLAEILVCAQASSWGTVRSSR